MTVNPAYQHQGIASLLVKSGLSVADAYRQGAYVMASPAGLRVYDDQGFEIAETTSTDCSRFGLRELDFHHFMVREPASV